MDVFLHRVCVLKSRTLAKEACERDKVTVNGQPAKPSREVAAGDHVRLNLGARILEVEVLGVPAGRVSRREAGEYYRVLADERQEPRV